MRDKPLKEIASMLGISCEENTQVAGYQIDSRKIEPGELFFALKGDKTDGHCFLGHVKDRGGLAAVVSNDFKGFDHGLILLRVENVLEALQALASKIIAQMKGEIVAVTGSMGKTTTKDFIATLLEGKYRVGKTYSSYNTKLTLPITLLNMKGDEEIIVLEMGMSEPKDIEKLVQIAPPDIAVITQIAMAHYGDHFPDGLDGVARAKAEIFSHPRTKKAILFHGFLNYPEAMKTIQCEKLTYSLEERSADYFLSGELVDERGVRAHRFDLPFKQPHVLHNFLGAVSVARAMKMEWEEIDRQVPKLKLPKMRFEQFEKAGILFINDTYNANPESMKAALSCCPEPNGGGKRIAALGRMIDLGSFSKTLHTEVGKFAQQYADHLLTFGDEAVALCEAFAEVKKPAEHFTELEALIDRLKELMSPGDVVLVKGSRDLQMERIFEQLDEQCCSC